MEHPSGPVFAYGCGFSSPPNRQENAASGALNRDIGRDCGGDPSGFGGHRTRPADHHACGAKGRRLRRHPLPILPHKQALLYAVTERYLGVVVASVEPACREHHGAPIGQMAEALVEAYWQAKIVRCQVTRALHLVAAEVDTAPLVEAFSKRIEFATAAMFASAPDASFADLEIVNLTLLTSLFGTVRSLFDRALPKPWACGVKQQLIFMVRAYLEAAKIPSQAVASPF